MSERKRKILTGTQKSNMREAVKEQKTVSEMAQEYGRLFHPNRIMEESLVGECQSTV